MRVPIIILLVAVLLSAFANTPATDKPLHGFNEPTYQASDSSSAWTQLLKAFTDVRTAEGHGAPIDSVRRLSLDLDAAFSFYENSTLLASQGDAAGSSHYATLSINQSSIISLEAEGLDSTARNAAQLRLEATFVTAFLLAAATATTITEMERLRAILHRFKTREPNLPTGA